MCSQKHPVSSCRTTSWQPDSFHLFKHDPKHGKFERVHIGNWIKAKHKYQMCHCPASNFHVRGGRAAVKILIGWLAGWLAVFLGLMTSIILDNLAQGCYFSDAMIWYNIYLFTAIFSLSSIDILNPWQEFRECSRCYASPAQKVWDWASSAALWRVRGARV